MKRFNILFSSFCLFFFSLQSAHATQWFWRATSGNNTSTTANWHSGGCTGTTGTPGTGDTVVFTTCSGSSTNCTIDANLSVKMVDVHSNYSSTISMNSGITLTMQIGSFKGGTFTGNTGAITCTSSFTIDGTAFTSSSGTFTNIGTFSFKSGTFTPNSGTVLFKKGTSSITIITGPTGTSPVNLTTITFYKVEFKGDSSSNTFDFRNITPTVTNELKISGSNPVFINSQSGTIINVTGNITSANSASTGGGGIYLVVNGTGSQSITDNQGSGISGKLPNVTINKSGGGTLSYVGTIGLGGSATWRYTSGTISEGTSKLICFYNDSIINNSGGTMKFYDLELQGNGGTQTIVNTVLVDHTFSTSQSGNCVINGGTLECQGNVNWNNTANSSWGNTTMKFSGSTADTITSASIVPQFYNMTINKTGTVKLSHELKVSNILTLTSGYLITDTTYLLDILNGATASGASSSSFVSGAVKKIGNSAFTFPIGKDSKYKPIAITAPSSSTDAFRAEYFDTAQTLGTTSDSLTYESQCEYWNVKRTTGSSSIKLTLYWDATTCDIYTLSTLKIGLWNGSQWHNTGMVTSTGTTTSGNIQNNSNQSSFGYFTICKRSPAVYAHAGSDTTFCAGPVVQLGGSPAATGGLTPYSYSWFPETRLSSSTSANPMDTAQYPIFFVLTVTDLDHSVAIDSVFVNAMIKPIANAGANRLICNQSPIIIGGGPASTNVTAPFNILWTAGADTISRLPNPMVSPSSNTKYILTVTNSNGCYSKDSVIVNVDPPLIVNAGRDTALTIGYNSLTLGGPPTVTGGNDPYSFSWNPAEKVSADSIANPTTNYQFTTNYELTVIDSLGCTAEASITAAVLPPLINKSGLYGFLSGHSISFTDSVSTSARAGAHSSISSNVTAADGLYINNSVVDSAITDLDSVIARFKRLPSSSISNNLSGQTYSPGVYKIDSAAYLSDTLTLSGGNSAYFIFIIRDSFVLNRGAYINNLTNSAGKVFFIVGGQCKVHHNVAVNGLILSQGDIEGDSISGNATLLASGNISLIHAVESLSLNSALFAPDNYVPTRIVTSISHSLDEDGDYYQDFLGYNSDDIKEVDKNGNGYGGWNNSSLINNLPLINAGTFRLHVSGGLWDWNKGWFYGPDLYQNGSDETTSLPINFPKTLGGSSTLDCISGDLFTPQPQEISNKLTDIKFSLDGNHADPLFLFDMMFTPYDYDEALLQFARALKINVKYIELGEEIYKGGNYDTYCTFPNAQSYVSEANTYLTNLHNLKLSDPTDYGNLEVAVPVSSPGFDFTKPKTSDASDGDHCREHTWNAALNLPSVGDAGQLDLDPYHDAISMHLYPSSGLDSKTKNLDGNYYFPDASSSGSDLSTMFSFPFENTNRYLHGELSLLPAGSNLKAWITEYNLNDQNALTSGTWAHGLYMATLTLQYLDFPSISHIYAQSMALDAGQGMLYKDESGYDSFHPSINDVDENSSTQITTRSWELTSAGNCLKLIAEAMHENTSAYRLHFSTSDLIKSSTTDTVLYGWIFETPNSSSGHPDNHQQAIILNLGPNTKVVDPSDLESLGSAWSNVGYEEISVPVETSGKAQDYLNPICYILGNDDVAYYHNTETSNNGIFAGASTNNDPNFPQLLHAKPKLITSLLQSEIAYSGGGLYKIGQIYISLKPYSITRIYEIPSTLQITCTAPENPCYHEFQNGIPIGGTSMNLSATGSSNYIWTAKIGSTDYSSTALSNTSGNHVLFMPQVAGTYTITVADADNLSRTATCPSTISAAAPPSFTLSPTSATYDPSTGAGVSLTATGSGSVYWWSPTFGLYSTSTGGSSTIQTSSGTAIYARPNQYTEYSDGIEPNSMQYSATGVESSGSSAGCFTILNTNITRKDISNNVMFVKYTHTNGTPHFCAQDGSSMKVTATSYLTGSLTFAWYNLITGVPFSSSAYTVSGNKSTLTIPDLTDTLIKVVIGNGSATEQSFARISILPDVNISPIYRLDLCQNESVNIKSSGADQYNLPGSYQWSTNTGNISGATNSSYTATPFTSSTPSTKYYTVTGTASSDSKAICQNAHSSSTITFTNAGTDPTVGTQNGTVTVVNGECALLSVSGGSNASYYEWTPPQYLQEVTGSSVTTVPMYTDQTFTVDGISTSSNISGCCESGTTTVTVTSHQWCDYCGFDNIVSFPWEKTFTIIDPPSGYTRDWQLNGSSTGESGTSFTISFPSKPGGPVHNVYRCKFENSSIGCTFYSETETVDYDFKEIDAARLQQPTIESSSINYSVNVYPNPTSGSFTVSIEGINQTEVPVQATVVDQYGRVMEQNTADVIGNTNILVNLNKNLPQGIYFLKLTIGKQIFIKPIVKF